MDGLKSVLLRESALLPRRILLTLLVPCLLVLAGTIGFHFLEDQPLFDSLYFTIVSLTTVGYGDMVPKTSAGKVFTMLLVVGGVFTLFYAATALIRVVVSGDVAALLGKRHMERTLAQMHNH